MVIDSGCRDTSIRFELAVIYSGRHYKIKVIDMCLLGVKCSKYAKLGYLRQTLPALGITFDGDSIITLNETQYNLVSSVLEYRLKLIFQELFYVSYDRFSF